MAPFNSDRFILELLVESILYDDEYGLYSNVILVDRVERREKYYGYYNPEEDVFVLEKITEWLPSPSEDEYLEAADGESMDNFEEPEGLARKLLELAEKEDLEPRVILGLEEEED